MHFKKAMQNKSFQRLKECISKKPCRIKVFKGLKDEIKEAMDLKEYKNRILQSHVKSKFSKTERAGTKKAFLRIIKKENEKNETMFFRIYA